jgi:hypothetical protein
MKETHDVSFTQDDKEMIDSLIIARDYLAHSHRLLRLKTKNKLEDGRLSTILPPSFIQDGTHPKLGWVGSSECALILLEKVTSFISSTSKNYLSTDVQKYKNNPPHSSEDTE